MRALGIDPGTKVVGYGIVESAGNRLKHIDNGGIFADKEKLMPERLLKIYDGICAVIEEFSPEVMSIEDVFYSRNVKTTIKLGQARGVAILAGIKKGLKIYEYSPTEIKSAVVGYGRAEKIQVQTMIKTLLALPENPQADAADALAAAICHLNSSGLQDRLDIKK